MFDAARIVPGVVIQFRYPRHNYHGVPGPTEFRRLRIDWVRDTAAVPVEAEFLAGNPLLRRSRYLVTGWDLDKGAERSFYDGSMKDVEAIHLTQEQAGPADYQVWIVEEVEPFSGIATLSPAGVYADLPDCLSWAESFNERELAEPLDAWAVVRASPAKTAMHHDAPKSSE